MRWVRAQDCSQDTTFMHRFDFIQFLNQSFITCNLALTSYMRGKCDLVSSTFFTNLRSKSQTRRHIGSDKSNAVLQCRQKEKMSLFCPQTQTSGVTGAQWPICPLPNMKPTAHILWGTLTNTTINEEYMFSASFLIHCTENHRSYLYKAYS